MRNLFTFCLSFSLLIVGGLACKNNPLAKFTKQYACTIAGEPEPQTSEDFVKRGYKHIELDNEVNRFNQCAFDAAMEALRLDSTNTEALGLRGGLYTVNNQYDAALDDFNEAIRLAPDNPKFYRFRSIVYDHKGMIKEEIEDLVIGMKNDASHHDYFHRGLLYFKIDDFENALKDYTEAIRLSPNDETYYSMRAEVYRKLGKNDLAEADELKAKTLELPVIDKKDSSNSNKPFAHTISGGVLNGKATNLVKPPYPPAAKAVRASGAVNVQVTIDEQGNVISASAVSGHPLLRASAVQAARASKFSPTILSGTPVKVIGVIVYNFTPE